jgi:hypothetical protein
MRRPTITVESFYLAHAKDGRAVMREKRGDAIAWIIRTKVCDIWEYALCLENGGMKRILGTVDLSVVEARLPRFRPTTGRIYGSSLYVH